MISPDYAYVNIRILYQTQDVMVIETIDVDTKMPILGIIQDYNNPHYHRAIWMPRSAVFDMIANVVKELDVMEVVTRMMGG